MASSSTNSSFVPRIYQNEIFETAIKQNTIALLGTGTGKTYIAVMLIKHLDFQIRKPYKEGGKRTIFLVPTVPLVNQQAKAIEDHIELKVGTYYGSKGIDNWSASTWEKEFINNHILVMTAEVFKIILNHSFMSLTDVNLIIFDECHQAVKNHPYREILKCFPSYPNEDRPQILGLTASLINGKCRPDRIENEIKKLEMTMNSSVVTASDLILLKECGTDPLQSIDVFEHYDLSCDANLQKINFILDKAIATLDSNDYGFKFFEDGEDNFFSSPKKCMRHVKNVLNSLGPVCTIYACQIFLKELNCLNAKIIDDIELKAIETTAKIIDKIQEILLRLTSNMSNLFFLIPNKLTKLLKILLDNKDGMVEEDGERSSLCCIIFVQQRIIAFILNMWLGHVKDTSERYNFIKSDYIVGHGMLASSFMSTVSMNVAKQEKVLQDFRSKSFNVLIATSVIEEGMDVPKCNLVIRFDPPKDFRAYVQSKGRARAKISFYKLMISTLERNDFIQDIISFEKIQAVLLKECKNRDLPNEDDADESLQDDVIPPYIVNNEKGCSRITLSSAISIVYRYCSLLPCDRASVLLPKWKLHKEKSPNEKLPLKYSCTLNFPINSCIKEPIKGPYMSRKKIAKMATALDACKMLHKLGELDEHLIPVGDKLTTKDLEIAGIDTTIEYGPSDGSKKRKRPYTKKIADPFWQKRPKNETSCFIYKIIFTKEIDDQFFKDNFEPELSTHNLGIISSKEIPKIPKSFTYTPGGTFKVDLKLIASNKFFKTESLQCLEKFNQKLYNTILKKKNDDYISNNDIKSGFNILSVPLKKDKPDWDLITSFLAFKEASNPPAQFHFEKHNYMDKIIIPYHKPETYFYVKHIHTDLTPQSQFSTPKYENYEEYFEEKYNLSITTNKQNLIECKNIYTCNMVIPRCKKMTATKMKKDIKYIQIYIPQLCQIHPLPASLLKQILCLPTIFYRLNSLLLAHELNIQIAGVNAKTKSRDSILDLDLNRILETSKTFIYPVQNPNKEGGRILFDYHPKLEKPFEISPVLVLNALTTMSAADVFNLERLETIGDSFLKFSVSLLVYKMFKRDEGKLTILRSSLICNKYLCRLANKKNLPEYIQNTMFEANSNWLPPLLNKDYLMASDMQEINDKTVADCVEALIGAYLLGCGPIGALNFMSWIGFKTNTSSEDLLKLAGIPKFVWLDMPTIEPYLNNDEQDLYKLYLGLEHFEEKINYNFKNKAYLIQALTHPSYCSNRLTGCYQRLEFLGDSILDYIITCYIFKDSQQLTPGQLTDLRSSLVNNSFFAFLAAMNDFHKYLKHMSPTLFNSIVNCLKIWNYPLSSFSSEGKIKEYLRIEQEIDYIFDVPKALGDIFESIAGAIYIDSGMSLDTVWKIYFPMMKSGLDIFSKDIPRHPVRIVLENYPSAQFEYNEKTKIVTLSIPSCGIFEGNGDNKIVAKLNAAKKAISYFRNKKN